ncbi:nicotinate (nicotinamide) nucleotide adenylyltransferase [Coraliomargarita sp. W4R53]
MKPTELASPSPSIALYGGSFDPVHCAHLCVARAALEQLSLDQVIFIPAAQSPLKANTAVASDAARIEMLRLAMGSESRFVLDTNEIERGGTSYTIDTVKHFRIENPSCQLHWIIGADQFELLPKWHCIEEIASLVTFIVLRRPGHSISKSLVPGLKYVAIEAPLMPHSSSEIRALLIAGRSTEDLLPASVEAFISAHGLYTQ